MSRRSLAHVQPWRTGYAARRRRTAETRRQKKGRSIPDFQNLAEQFRLARELRHRPPVTVRLFGGADARAHYDFCTRRHHAFPFVREMTFGVALMPLPADPANPFPGQALANFRRRRRRALDRGYTFAEFDGTAHIDRMLAINVSASQRQGHPMTRAYTDEAAVKRYAQIRRPFFGAFDAQGVLRAYLHAPTLGDTVVLERIIGEHDHLADGIVYLLVWETAVKAALERNAHRFPNWMHYASFIGGGRGLRIFKEECGFRPHRVDWQWLDKPSDAPSA